MGQRQGMRGLVMQTAQQARARYALKKIDEFVKLPVDSQGELRSYASSLPAMIHMNGFGQAMAFCKSKGGSHNKLYELLQEWLRDEGKPYHGQPDDLLRAITEGDMHTYRLAQAEAQALMAWVQKFTRAYLESGMSDNNNPRGQKNEQADT